MANESRHPLRLELKLNAATRADLVDALRALMYDFDTEQNSVESVSAGYNHSYSYKFTENQKEIPPPPAPPPNRVIREGCEPPKPKGMLR